VRQSLLHCRQQPITPTTRLHFGTKPTPPLTASLDHSTPCVRWARRSQSYGRSWRLLRRHKLRLLQRRKSKRLLQRHDRPCHVMTHTASPWHAMTHTASPWHAMTHTASAWHVMTRTDRHDTSWRILQRHDTSWRILQRQDASQCSHQHHYVTHT